MPLPEHLPNDEAIENIAKRLQKSIDDAKKHKVMFSVDVFQGEKKSSIIDYSILILYHLMEQDKNVTETGKEKLRPLMLEMFNLVSTGTDVSQEVRRLLPEDILKERGEYLSRLKQIVSDSIENDKKKGIVVERDNKFYYVQCPEKSVITPAKFMNSPEFKDLEYGALRIGEGDNLI